MQIEGERARESRCPNIYIISETGKNQWESFNPENAKYWSLNCLWGFMGCSVGCCLRAALGCSLRAALGCSLCAALGCSAGL